MRLKWFGHSCFSIEHNGFTILTDPFDNCVSYKRPDISPDLITVSHYHGDHSDADMLEKAPVVDNTTEEYSNHAFSIRRFDSFHDESYGSERGENSIFLFECSNGIRIVHLGDLGHTEGIDKHALSCDILLAPFGGFFTIDGDRSYVIAQELGAKILVPMHFKTEKVDFELKELDDYNMHFVNKDILDLNDRSGLPDNLCVIRLDFE